MRVELWSIYYSPVPLGIGPVAGALARELATRGHEVTVVTSHPHYPKPEWGTSWRRKRHVSDGVEVIELPVYPRRQSPLQRAGEEASYAFKHSAWALRRSDADVIIATMPSLLCIPAALLQARRGTPFVVWLQDIVSAAATQTDLGGAARIGPALARLEQAAFDKATRTVVISDAFQRQLLELGVPERRLERIFLGAPRAVHARSAADLPGRPTVLVIGNIGLTQNLAAFVRAFQDSEALAGCGAELRITGDGVAADAVREAIDGDRVRYLGVVSEEQLESELERATVGLVTQGAGVTDFNLPSKVVTYMASGLPVFAVADPATDLSRMVNDNDTGLAVANDDLDVACERLAGLLSSPEQLVRSAAGSLAFARDNFEPAAMAARFERVLEEAVAEGVPGA